MNIHVLGRELAIMLLTLIPSLLLIELFNIHWDEKELATICVAVAYVLTRFLWRFVANRKLRPTQSNEIKEVENDSK